ncbi:uncharacterized protein [Blastocystis hominis]|uniref:Uncharacterized protein n=1 Tax=Blastocystis hominis TaxID=12968 RepID=D8LVP5_BLAHO|nr:uncharacterized protein [Blastocystis hominis]CBK19884.2 unnamed protein product [Blastocystis hominis]|eukprot:XP_012893932.1 uncharacterized protein [Blastocystis hominis]
MFSWAGFGREEENDDVSGDAFQMNDDLDFSDEEDDNKAVNGETMVNGSNVNTRVAELESEIQQRDSLLQMKTDELRRIALQNHDYEVEVLFE